MYAPKSLIVTGLLCLTSFFVFSQQTDLPSPIKKVDHSQTDWYLEMQSARPNWYQVERLKRAYFQEHPNEKSTERRQCERWLHTMRPLLDTEGYVQDIINTEQDFIIPKPMLSTRGTGNDRVGTWRMIGPYHEEKSCNGNGNADMPGGFCDRVYINPYNTNNLFSGQSYGGLWVSKDQGATWKLTDAEFPNGTNTYANRDYYYGEIEANKLNSNLVYAATEAGLLKSINGGDSWTLCPQLNRTIDVNTRPYFIAQALNDQTTILSTFGKKLFRSTDAGQTWAMAFDNSNGGSSRTGTNQHGGQPFGLYDRTYNFWGLCQHPTDNNVFYVGIKNNANEALIYKSTDKGATFSLLLNVNQKIGKAPVAAIQIKTIAAAPDKIFVYGLFNKENIYKFDKNGNLLETVVNPLEYYEAFDINWLDESKVYNSYYSLNYISKSADGGKSFTDVKGSCNVNVHADPRDISAVGNLILVATDGGIYLSKDGGATFPSVGDDISAIDLWGFSSAFKSDVLLVGCDHGPNMLRTVDTLRAWKRLLGADAGASTINPANENLMYLDWGYGKSKGELQPNGALSLSPTTDITFHKLEFNPLIWNTSYGINGNKVFISTDNTTTNTLLYDFGVKVNQVKVALKDTSTMYVLLRNQSVWKSSDAGKTWSDITPSVSVSKNQKNIVYIEVGKTPQEIWVAYGNKQNACKLLKSINGGTSWTDLTGNLSTAPIMEISYQRGTEGGVYVAMQGNGGVWYRNNNLTEWKQLGQGLPMLGYIQQIYTVPAKNKFRMGSSRGAFEHELYEASHLDAHFAANTRFVYCGDKIQFRDFSAYSKTSGVKFNWTFTGGTPATSTVENPVISYANAAAGKYSVSLTITDAAGNTSSYSVPNFVEVTKNTYCNISTEAGKAMDLSIISGSANLPSLPITKLPFTLTMWVKPNGLQKSFSQIISQSNIPRSKNLPHFGLGFAFKGYVANNNLVFTAKDVSYGLTSAHDLPPNAWSHVAVVVEATKVTIYNDGKPWVYNGTITAPDFETYPLIINSDIHGQGGNYKGMIDEIAIYNTALTQNDIRETMHLTKTGIETNLIAYYQFNQYANNKVYDPKGGYDLTNVGSALVNTPSTAPVSSGVSKRLATSNATNLDFTGTYLTAQLNATTTNEVIAYRLNAAPNFVPNNSNSVKNYWILRTWGNDATFNTKLTSLTFSNTGLKSSTAQLFTRSANEDTNVWINANVAPSGNISFFTQGRVVQNSQIALLGELNTPIVDINEQKLSMSVSPNPTAQSVEVRFSKVEKALDVELTIIDRLGRQLQQKSVRLNLFNTVIPLDLTAYASGIYHIVVQHRGKIIGNMLVQKL